MNGEMSAIGTKRTSRVALHMSAFGGKANSPDLPVTSTSGPEPTSDDFSKSRVGTVVISAELLPVLTKAAIGVGQ